MVIDLLFHQLIDSYIPLFCLSISIMTTVALAAWFLLFAAAACTTSSNCTLYTGRCQADWMGELPLSVQRAPFKDIIVVGSHDSATHRLDFTATPPMSGSISNDIFQILLELNLDPFTALIVGPPTLDLTVTQHVCIAEQLEQGIRALDLRVLYNGTSETFFFAHSFAAVPFIETLQGIADFMNKHPREIVTIQIAPDWPHRHTTEPVWTLVLGNVSKILGQWMVPNLLQFQNFTQSRSSHSQTQAFVFSSPPPLPMIPRFTHWFAQ